LLVVVCLFLPWLPGFWWFWLASLSGKVFSYRIPAFDMTTGVIGIGYWLFAMQSKPSDTHNFHLILLLLEFPCKHIRNGRTKWIFFRGFVVDFVVGELLGTLK